MGTRTKALKRKPAIAPISALVDSKIGTIIISMLDAAPVVELSKFLNHQAFASHLSRFVNKTIVDVRLEQNGRQGQVRESVH